MEAMVLLVVMVALVETLRHLLVFLQLAAQAVVVEVVAVKVLVQVDQFISS